MNREHATNVMSDELVPDASPKINPEDLRAQELHRREMRKFDAARRVMPEEEPRMDLIDEINQQLEEEANGNEEAQQLVNGLIDGFKARQQRIAELAQRVDAAMAMEDKNEAESGWRTSIRLEELLKAGNERRQRLAEMAARIDAVMAQQEKAGETNEVTEVPMAELAEQASAEQPKDAEEAEATEAAEKDLLTPERRMELAEAITDLKNEVLPEAEANLRHLEDEIKQELGMDIDEYYEKKLHSALGAFKLGWKILTNRHLHQKMEDYKVARDRYNDIQEMIAVREQAVSTSPREAARAAARKAMRIMRRGDSSSDKYRAMSV